MSAIKNHFNFIIEEENDFIVDDTYQPIDLTEDESELVESISVNWNEQEKIFTTK